MSEIKVTSINAEGVSVQNLSEMTEDERIAFEIDAELAIANVESFTLVCVTCGVGIPSGLGHCYCANHIPARYRNN